jgi:hypothetical protein
MHAVDLVATNAIGVRAPGVAPAEPTAYRIFGVPGNHVILKAQRPGPAGFPRRATRCRCGSGADTWCAGRGC